MVASMADFAFLFSSVLFQNKSDYLKEKPKKPKRSPFKVNSNVPNTCLKEGSYCIAVIHGMKLRTKCT